MKYLVVHCSDSPHRGDTAADVHRWHTQRGWAGIGYHAVIREDGLVESGRPLYWEGAHVRGHNKDSLGVMLFGTDYFTPSQYKALGTILRLWKLMYPEAEVCGHSDLDPHKTCPNFDVKKWWAEVNDDQTHL